MKKIIFLISCFFCMVNLVDAVTLTCSEIAAPDEEFSCLVVDDDYIGIKSKYIFGEEFIYEGMKINNSWKSYYMERDGFSLGNVSNDEKLDISFNLKVKDNVKVNQDYLIELADVEVVDSNYQYIKLDNISTKIKIVSNDNTLSSLEVNGNKVDGFVSDVTSYKISVNSDKVLIGAVANEEGAVVSGDIGEKNLEYGVNNFVIKVTSARGKDRNYYLYVTREMPVIKKDNDFTLKSLSLSNGEVIELEKDIYLYSVNVDYSVDNIEVEAVPNSSKAKVVIEKPEKLVVGENNIVIVVTAEDGNVGKYVVVINRMEKLSNDASIKELNIKGYEINFESGKFFYELKLDDEKKLDIDVILNDEKAKYQIIGNENLVNDSVITIQVVAEDGSEQGYKIKIIKELFFNSRIVGSGINVIGLIGLILLIMSVFSIKIVKKKQLREIK